MSKCYIFAVCYRGTLSIYKQWTGEARSVVSKRWSRASMQLVRVRVRTLVRIPRLSKVQRERGRREFERRGLPVLAEEDIGEDATRVQRRLKNLQTLQKTASKVLDGCMLYYRSSGVTKLANLPLTSISSNT